MFVIAFIFSLYGRNADAQGILFNGGVVAKDYDVFVWLGHCNYEDSPLHQCQERAVKIFKTRQEKNNQCKTQNGATDGFNNNKR